MNMFMTYCIRLLCRSRNKDVTTIDLGSFKDPAERNPCLTPDGTLYLIDWDFAGVYSVILEHFSLTFLSDVHDKALARSVLLKEVQNESVIAQLYEVFHIMLTMIIVS